MILVYLGRSDLVKKVDTDLSAQWERRQREVPPLKEIKWQPQANNEIQLCLCGDSQLVVDRTNGQTAVKTALHLPHVRIVRSTLANVWAEGDV